MADAGGYYAKFARGMSLLLMGAGVVIGLFVVAVMISMIYVLAYGLPIFGAGLLLMAGSAILSGHFDAGVAGIIMGILCIGIGSGAYIEYFIGRYGDLPLLTELPEGLVNRLKWVWNKL